MASPASKKIGGKVVWIPGAYTHFTYIPNVLGVAATKQLYLVGESEGGKPGMPHLITSDAQARTILQGGLLLEAVLTALQASPLGSPGQVYVWNIAKLTQAAAAFNQGATKIFDVKSAEYGSRANQISVEIKDSGDTLIVKRGAVTEEVRGIGQNLFWPCRKKIKEGIKYVHEQFKPNRIY